jgi:ABC-type arginine/histidine transport system permease subunit
MTFSLVIATVLAVAINHARSTTQSDVTLEPWQIINLIGAPMLALLFLPTAVDDIRRWIQSLREDSPSSRR